MKALKVAKRAKAGGYTYHWLIDSERTACGRRPAELQIVDQLELERLPAVEACHHCVRTLDGWVPEQPRNSAEIKITAEPQGGRLRTTGALSHGFNRRSGRRLA
jgi:hypothetical protein